MEVKSDVKNKTVIYNNGKEKIIKKGGTVAWRTNNPGNLSYGSLEGAVKDGAIGVYRYKTYKFGIFPDFETGEKALKNLWKNKWKNIMPERTVKEAMFIYSPPEDNNTSKYIDNINKKVDANKKIKDLNDNDFDNLFSVIKKQEGNGLGIEKREKVSHFGLKIDNEYKEFKDKPIEYDATGKIIPPRISINGSVNVKKHIRDGYNVNSYTRSLPNR